MKNISIVFIVVLSILTACSTSSNDECNDCLEITTKSIKYIDSSGANLLFGNQAIYNPDNIIIQTENGNTVSFWKEEDTGTILFDLEGDDTSYQIVLSDTLIDTLEFELDERKSMSCCGNVIFSTKTLLNGQEIENDDLIIINQ
jgi:hypothetical protein